MRDRPTAPALTRRAMLGTIAGAGAALSLTPWWRSLAAAVPPASSPPAPLRLLLVVPAAAAPGARTADIRDGAMLGAEEAARTAALLGGTVELRVEERDDSGDAEAMTRLARAAAAGALLGGTRLADALALAAAATALGVPFLNVGCASDALRGERCAAAMFHVAPSMAMRLDAALLWLSAREDGARWRVALPAGADGDALRRRALSRLAATPGGRALDERVLGPAAGDAPRVLLDAEAGGGGDRYGAAVLPWHHALARYGAAQLNDRFRARFGRPMPADAWPAWMAAKIAWEGASGPRSARAPRERFAVAAARFDGHKGRALDFRDWDHQLRQPLYLAERPAGGDPPRLATAPPDGGGEPARVVLDRLGVARAESACTLAPA